MERGEWKGVRNLLPERPAGCFAQKVPDPFPELAPLLVCDETLYRFWMDRALANITAAAARGKVSRRRQFQRLADRYESVVQRLSALAVTFIHGEFYASNILVSENGTSPRRICPVDWELAAIGTGLLDLAALTAGSWSEGQRLALVRAYYDALAAEGNLTTSFEKLLEDLDYCRLHLAVQWLGWARNWTPPKDQAQDWLGEALRVAGKLGL